MYLSKILYKKWVQHWKHISSSTRTRSGVWIWVITSLPGPGRRMHQPTLLLVHGANSWPYSSAGTKISLASAPKSQETMSTVSFLWALRSSDTCRKLQFRFWSILVLSKILNLFYQIKLWHCCNWEEEWLLLEKVTSALVFHRHLCHF